eukprot:12249563-Prorocentrum_lima.AAC.1
MANSKAMRLHKLRVLLFKLGLGAEVVGSQLLVKNIGVAKYGRVSSWLSPTAHVPLRVGNMG